tara:strand:- start:967 stop:2874 length:1908 start_codon:yes stop_codon:yes gene_type:complete
MALVDFKILPGIDKQTTSAGAEQRWIDSDNTRFRYGLPEKVGGWQSPVKKSIVGIARQMHAFANLSGKRYIIIGTDKFLLAYYDGELYDITPLSASLGAGTITTVASSANVTITLNSHGLVAGQIILMTSTTLPSGTGYTTANFDNKLFQVTSITDSNNFVITQSSAATGNAGPGGSITVTPYVTVGPQVQTIGYGWGTSTWGNGNWGEDSTGEGVVLEPGLWSLDNYGSVLIATIANGPTFTWNSNESDPQTTRASQSTSGFVTTNNPISSRFTMVSPTTRHLVHFGSVVPSSGGLSSQDNMAVVFSDQENINSYTPTSVNTAGSQILQDGTKIMTALRAKESMLVWTDNALYNMRFIGAPFTFGFEQVGTNCGVVGKNAAVEIDGVAFWMSPKGFFAFDGTVKSLPCSVEDYVYDDIDTTKGQQVFAGINNLYTEVVWWYPSANSDYNDRYVVYNYSEKVWYTGTEPRTSWIDAEIYAKPFGTKFTSTGTANFPVVLGESGLGKSQLFEHEIGNNQVDENGTPSKITSFIKSFDFDLQQQGGVVGEVFLAVRRFVPDFESITGDATITLNIKRYPQQSDAESTLSPFTITSSTDKKDTRARGRFVNLQIENKDLNQSWRFGTFRLDIQPDGRR